MNPQKSPQNPHGHPLRDTVYRIIFEADTFWGKFFDIALIICILSSVMVVMLDSVVTLHARFGALLYVAEWIFTLLFSFEYLLRLMTSPKPGRYARSFFGIVDLLSIIPTYLSLFVVGAHYMLVIRVLRIMRIFRILKLGEYIQEATTLVRALQDSARKILVFISAVMTIVVIFGALMYVVEGPEHGFTSIPRSIYWAIVTLTTVGYGDISPQTELGQIVASAIMIVGYGIIAVPTGIVTVSLNKQYKKQYNQRCCEACGLKGHEADALFCRNCGSEIDI